MSVKEILKKEVKNIVNNIIENATETETQKPNKVNANRVVTNRPRRVKTQTKGFNINNAAPYWTGAGIVAVLATLVFLA